MNHTPTNLPHRNSVRTRGPTAPQPGHAGTRLRSSGNGGPIDTRPTGHDQTPPSKHSEQFVRRPWTVAEPHTETQTPHTRQAFKSTHHRSHRTPATASSPNPPVDTRSPDHPPNSGYEADGLATERGELAGDQPHLRCKADGRGTRRDGGDSTPNSHLYPRQLRPRQNHSSRIRLRTQSKQSHNPRTVQRVRCPPNRAAVVPQLPGQLPAPRRHSTTRQTHAAPPVSQTHQLWRRQRRTPQRPEHQPPSPVPDTPDRPVPPGSESRRTGTTTCPGPTWSQACSHGTGRALDRRPDRSLRRRPRRRASADTHPCAADTNARITCSQCHRELAGTAQVLTLVQCENSVLGDQAQLPCVGTERGGRRAGRRVLHDAADGNGSRTWKTVADSRHTTAVSSDPGGASGLPAARSRNPDPPGARGSPPQGQDGGRLRKRCGAEKPCPDRRAASECGKRLAQVGVGDLFEVRLDAGQRCPEQPAFLHHVHRHGARARSEHQSAGTDPLASATALQRWRARRTDLGLGTEITDAVRPPQLAVQPSGGAVRNADSEYPSSAAMASMSPSSRAPASSTTPAGYHPQGHRRRRCNAEPQAAAHSSSCPGNTNRHRRHSRTVKTGPPRGPPPLADGAIAVPITCQTELAEARPENRRFRSLQAPSSPRSTCVRALNPWPPHKHVAAQIPECSARPWRTLDRNIEHRLGGTLRTSRPDPRPSKRRH